MYKRIDFLILKCKICLAVKKEKDIRSLHTKERRDLERTDIRKRIDNLDSLYCWRMDI